MLETELMMSYSGTSKESYSVLFYQITHVYFQNRVISRKVFLSVCRSGGVRHRGRRHVPAHPEEGLPERDLHRLRLFSLLLCRDPHGDECKIYLP